LFTNKISKVPKLCQELDKKQEVLISDNRPIMVCKNTMNKSKKCVFCKCFDCHMNEVLHKEKDDKKKGDNCGDDHQVVTPRNRSRRVQRANNVAHGQTNSTKIGKGSSESDNIKCNHIDDLSLFTDCTFFTRSYKAKNQKINESKKTKIYLPTKCSICHCEIVTKIGKKG